MNPVTQSEPRKSSLLGEAAQCVRDPHRRWPILICGLILAAAAFLGPLDIAEGSSSETQSRLARIPVLMFKLATSMAAGLVGAWGIICVPQARRVLLTLPGLMLSAIAAIFLVTCLVSITSASLPIALVFLAYLLFIPTCLTVLGLRGSLAWVLWGLLWFSLGALFLYVFVPRYGVYQEDFGGGVIIERLGGMSQPNHTSRSAMLGLLISVYFVRLPRAPRALGVLLICFFLAVGVLALSRTALLAALICLGLLNLDLLLTRAGAALACLAVMAGIAVVFALAATGREDVLVDKLLSSVTKTGDIEEVTSVTGRFEIWQETLKLIKARPLQGYGLGSAKVLLVDHLQSTHNILLHPTLSAGIFAGGLTLILLAWNAVNVALSPQLIVRSLSAYILISGLSEDTIYETFPGPCTLLWLTCCLWPCIAPRPSKQ